MMAEIKMTPDEETKSLLVNSFGRFKKFNKISGTLSFVAIGFLAWSLLSIFLFKDTSQLSSFPGADVPDQYKSYAVGPGDLHDALQATEHIIEAFGFMKYLVLIIGAVGIASGFLLNRIEIAVKFAMACCLFFASTILVGFILPDEAGNRPSLSKLIEKGDYSLVNRVMDSSSQGQRFQAYFNVQAQIASAENKAKVLHKMPEYDVDSIKSNFDLISASRSEIQASPQMFSYIEKIVNGKPSNKLTSEMQAQAASHFNTAIVTGVFSAITATLAVGFLFLGLTIKRRLYKVMPMLKIDDSLKSSDGLQDDPLSGIPDPVHDASAGEESMRRIYKAWAKEPSSKYR